MRMVARCGARRWPEWCEEGIGASGSSATVRQPTVPETDGATGRNATEDQRQRQCQCQARPPPVSQSVSGRALSNHCLQQKPALLSPLAILISSSIGTNSTTSTITVLL